MPPRRRRAVPLGARRRFVIAEQYHVAPPACSGALQNLVGSLEKQKLGPRAAHVSNLAGRITNKLLF